MIIKMFHNFEFFKIIKLSCNFGEKKHTNNIKLFVIFDIKTDRLYIKILMHVLNILMLIIVSLFSSIVALVS